MGGAAGVAWLWLAVAGLAEMGWVVLMKHSDGFARLWPSLSVAAVMALSLFCMSQSLRTLPMGTVYAVWTGIGAVGGIAWGIAMEGEPATLLRLGCLGLILAGVVGLKLGS
jgi:quaternary ammonium compound-resistance protein SugE